MWLQTRLERREISRARHKLLSKRDIELSSVIIDFSVS